MSKDRKDHLDEWSMQTYFDEGLTEAERATMNAHLVECEVCAGAFANMEYLFLEMRRLPDKPLTNDLSAGVIRSLLLNENKKSGWYLILVGQLTAAIIVLLAMWRKIPLDLGSWVSPAQVLEPLQDFIDFSAQGNLFLKDFVNRVYAQWVATLFMPAIDWPISALALTMVVGTLILLWLVGNGFLLQKPSNGPVRHG